MFETQTISFRAREKEIAAEVGKRNGLMRVSVSQDMRFFETVFQHQFFVPQEFTRRSICNDQPAIQHNCPGTQFDGHFEVVRGNEFGDGEGF